MTDFSVNEQLTSRAPALRPGEIKYLTLALLAFIAFAGLSQWRGQAIDWMSFLPGYVYSLGLLAIGMYVRVYKKAERLAVVAVALAGYALFGMSMGVVFHIYMPRPEPILGELLLGFDHFFGYHWPDAVVWLAESYPTVGLAMSYIYLSSFAQLIGVIVVLGVTGRDHRLHLLLLTGMIGLFLTFVVWQLLPNLSMGAQYPIPAEAEQAIRLVTNTAYGEMIRDAALNGIPVIGMDSMLGAVAFPSYHTVMACLTVWFVYKTFAFWPAVLINIPMIPAIHIHGAHHIMDFLGGIVIFFAALVLSHAILAMKTSRRAL